MENIVHNLHLFFPITYDLYTVIFYPVHRHELLVIQEGNIHVPVIYLTVTS
jgi:hypothetical protein